MPQINGTVTRLEEIQIVHFQRVYYVVAIWINFVAIYEICYLTEL